MFLSLAIRTVLFWPFLLNLTLVLNSRAEWRKYTIDGHKKYVEYQEKLRKNLGPKSPAIYNGMAWEIYQRIRLGLSKDKKSDIKKLVEYSKADVACLQRCICICIESFG